MNNDCVFCKIAAKIVPSSIVYENDEFFVFLDINPVTKGHTMIIPREHHIWMQETPDEIVGKSFILAKKIMLAIKKAFDAEYVQINVVGEQIPHFHIHLYPRWTDDGVTRLATTTYKDNGEEKEYAQKIKNAI